MCKGGGSAVYGLGFIGALVFFFQQASSFVDVLVAFFKSLFWPAYLVYQLFSFLA